MLKKTQLILLIVFVFSAAFLLSNTMVGAGEPADFTYAEVDDGQIQFAIVDGVPYDPCGKDAVTGECVPMMIADLWLCEGEPSYDSNGNPITNDNNCRKFSSSTLCFSYNLNLATGGILTSTSSCNVFPILCP